MSYGKGGRYMNCRIVDMRHKEVINAKDGMRLGFVDDVEVDTCTAKLVAIIIYGRLKLLGLFGRCDDIVICWDEIELIGEDTIIVNHCCKDKKKRKFKNPFVGFTR